MIHLHILLIYLNYLTFIILVYTIIFNEDSFTCSYRFFHTLLNIIYYDTDIQIQGI